MPLSTAGLIEELRRFRSDKLALVALLGSMGAVGPEDALERLREIVRISGEELTRIRGLPIAERRRAHASEALWRDVRELAVEAEPWLARVAERASTGQTRRRASCAS